MNTQEYRNIMGGFATGVTVITTGDQSQHYSGMTANSFSSLSLEPSLIMWAIDKGSTNFEEFTACKAFAVHVLHKGQANTAYQFAKNDSDRFADVDFQVSNNHTPLLNDFLVRIECDLETTYDGGDHIIIVGKVTEAAQKPGEPLVFYKGKMGEFVQTSR